MNSFHPLMLLEGFKRSIVTYTRLPLKMVWAEEKPHTSPVAFLPIIGLLIALISSWPLFVPAFDLSLVALFMLLTAVLLTGAFHEDGFMDSLDGLIGGADVKQRLTIMKDSRLGSYAAIGIWFLLSMKWLLLTKLLNLTQNHYLVIVLWVGIHSFSRITPIFIMQKLSYITLGHSKAQGMIYSLKPSEWLLVFIPIIAFIVCVNDMAFKWYLSIAIFALILVLTLFLTMYFKHKIHGFTGDTLGAAEQLSELSILLFLVIFLPIFS